MHRWKKVSGNRPLRGFLPDMVNLICMRMHIPLPSQCRILRLFLPTLTRQNPSRFEYIPNV